jgi:hypothetical protein
MTDQHSALSLDGAAVQTLNEIRDKGQGLFTRALILINNAQDFSDDSTSYLSPVYPASGGGTDTFLRAGTYHDKDEASLSGKDSEVAALQDAWDWLSEHNAQSVLVVLVSNIGPCNACKQRLANFRAACAEYYGANLTVQVIYGQSGGAAKDMVRGEKKIKTAYGYQDAGAHTLSDETKVWVRTVT